MRYRIAIHPSEEGFSVSVPPLPGCWSQGATYIEAIENIKEAIREYCAVAEEPLPQRVSAAFSSDSDGEIS